MSADDARAALEAELDRWQSEGLRPRLFWRDDDAVADTPALRRLAAVIEGHGTPLLLAAIPGLAQASLGELVRANALMTGAVHGWRHESHSPAGEKPCELDAYRPIETVLAEQRAGRERLGNLFAGKLSGLAVPPWNRIHDDVLARIGEAGFAGVSAHGWGERPTTGAVAMVNVHVDIIHWSGGQIGRERDWVFTELTRGLAEARQRGGRAVGLLTHHLVHDEKAWAAMAAILDVAGPGRADWVAADDLLPAAVPGR